MDVQERKKAHFFIFVLRYIMLNIFGARYSGKNLMLFEGMDDKNAA